MDSREVKLFGNAFNILLNARLEKYGISEHYCVEAVHMDERRDSTYPDACEEHTDGKTSC